MAQSSISQIARVENIQKDYPYLICEDDGNIVGYAYAARHRERGIYTAYAGVTLPNDKSIGLHKWFGFNEVGV